ncbi:hypothetical protein IWW36_002297 [Coemansia brasiliensis]|uniref:PX domain-containing protein n=1 Tax=Coemansia brasiliensis TaxID=2650707 RepID=A0A9W8LY94_9FUNG|nr:hypothetical protein IWW36_002297 [Coemansia brasiliensis]
MQGQLQQLQTVAVEASSLLRAQSITVLQTQAIRLDDIGVTELEDHQQLDLCMNELMLGILYTELRKDIQQITDSLEQIQNSMFSSHGNTSANASVLQLTENEETSEEMVTAEEPSELNEFEQPPPLSAKSETFSTARGLPLVLSNENGGPKHDAVDELCESIDLYEQKLYAACMEIDEWRRTTCLQTFIRSVQSRQSREPRPASVSSVRSSIQFPRRVLEGIRQRAHSVGGSELLAPSLVKDGGAERHRAGSPMSRLMQVEREFSAQHPHSPILSATSSQRRPSSSVPHTANTDPGHMGYSPPSFQPLLPYGQAQHIYHNTLSLLDQQSLANSSEGAAQSRPKTIVDDVRIIGWVTRGRGLDVHTEFKVLVHLSQRNENLTVLRRYSDFELLRDVLCERFRTFSKRVPQLPRKKAFGKFENSFLKKRESGLQFFLAYVMLHPVIGCSSIIKQWLEGPSASW